MKLYLLRKMPLKVFFSDRASAEQFRRDRTHFAGGHIYEVEPDRPDDIPIGRIFDERSGAYLEEDNVL